MKALFHSDPPDLIDRFWAQVNAVSAVLLGIILLLFFGLGLTLSQLQAARLICGL